MQGHSVTKAFTHFTTIDFEVIIMKPVVCERLAGDSLALRNLISVVYGNVINAAGVNIDCFTE